jgi:hypothetical protein
MSKITLKISSGCGDRVNVKYDIVVVGVLGLAPCHCSEKNAGTSTGVPGDILGSYEELRWMEPHMSSPSESMA